MAWFVLIVSGICESVWAIALDRSEGFSRLAPTVAFVLGLAASMGGLGYAMRYIPVGTSYVVWVGVGAAITAVYGMASGEEPVSCARVLLVAGLVACAVGLRLVR
ncbi:DMT family transporter [Bifidobacterium avesanii]|uniref:QacE family quaternary ammonium compound efflux SMR transporter n=1 Tax=Bifidobacterium avesanii TaxID=1798157 RepID=A0A7K3TGU6_9BIFI|nr:multidrug efflux SMR transporter [Bifidobacterium avesanii]KAB8293548.1 ligand-binding protein SH3 [Bifidobacterium avesanii]NEG78315.1 QacE family quaternary ammonium compound efflux SMR transporter [Bifidobacterium avesanii]